MKKKLLLIHNSNRENINLGKLDCYRDVTGMVRLARDWKEQTWNRSWQQATTEECEGYEFVMLIVLPEQNPDKINKYLEIASKPGRGYKVLIYIPDVCGWQMNPFLPENKLLYMDTLTAADFVFRVNLPGSESYWKAVMRDKPSYFLERAYPVKISKDINKLDLPRTEEIIGKYIPDPKSQKFIFVGKSLKNINEERNVICSLYIARKIQEKTGWGVVCFANNALKPGEKDDLYMGICGLEDVIELPVVGWVEYLGVLRTLNFQVGVYLDCLETRGQVALDCACSRIPLICSGSIAGYKLYHRATWIDHCRDIDKALEVANRIVDDAEFKKGVIDNAYKMVNDYSFENTRNRIEKIIGATL